MSPVIRNARIAPLAYARSLGPRRGEPDGNPRAESVNVKADGDVPKGTLHAVSSTPDADGPIARTDPQGEEKTVRTPTPASTSTRAAPRQPLMHTDAEAARRAGLEEGRAQGQQQGREEGLKEGKEEGRKLGLEQGLEEGKLQGEQQARLKLEQETDIQRRAEEQRALDAAEASAKALQDLHAHLQQADESLQAKAELLAVDLAWTALTRLLADGAGKREAVAGMVRAVLDETRAQQIVRIGLAAADLALLQADLPSDFAGFELHADARVQSGGCIVETVAGALDGRLETRLQMLRQLLLSRPNAAGEEAS